MAPSSFCHTEENLQMQSLNLLILLSHGVNFSVWLALNTCLKKIRQENFEETEYKTEYIKTFLFNLDIEFSHKNCRNFLVNHLD